MNPLSTPAHGAPAGPALHDIHLPPTPGWWPLAPGWWLVMMALLVLLGVALFFTWRWRRRRRAWRVIANELDALDGRYREKQEAAPLASGLSQLLRRAVLHRGGDAHLHGAAWHAELTRLAPDMLPATLLDELSNAQYRPQATFDGERAMHACRRWLRKVMRGAHA